MFIIFMECYIDVVTVASNGRVILIPDCCEFSVSLSVYLLIDTGG